MAIPINERTVHSIAFQVGEQWYEVHPLLYFPVRRRLGDVTNRRLVEELLVHNVPWKLFPEQSNSVLVFGPKEWDPHS